MTRAKDTRDVYKILIVNLNAREHLENLDIDEEKIQKWILRKWDGRMQTGFTVTMVYHHRWKTNYWVRLIYSGI